MTKEDIKKALEICTDIDRPCGSCPYDNVTNCCDTLKHDMYKLCIEQEREIERLRTTLGQCNTELNSALESLKSQCREIGKLKAEVKQAKIDVLTELRERITKDRVANDTVVINVNYEIKELIKEVQNGEDKG